MTGTETAAGRPLERGLLMNALGIIVKASRTVYLILFGRILGAEGFGIYLLAFAVQEFISKFAILGLNWGGKQIVGALKAQGRDHSIRPTVIKILWITLSFSSLVAVAMAQGAALLAAMLNQDSLAGPLRIFAIGFPFLCGMYVLVYSFRPNLNMKYEMVVTSIVEPMSVLLLGIAFLSGFRNVEVLAWAHVGASIVAFFTALYFFNRIYPSIESRGSASIDWSMLLHGSATMGGMELVGNLQSKIDLFIMALFFPPHIIGIYGAATQIASLLRKSRAAFDPILMPIAQLLHIRSDHEQLQAEVSRAVGWAVCIGLGLLGLMVLIPEQLLGLFGSEFSGGIFGTVLIILAIGQFFHMSGGLSEGILAITGHGYVSLVSGVILVLSECALLFALIPLWGLTGAAIAASVPFIGVTLWRVAQTRRLLGIGMFTMDQTRIVLAWAACLAVALVVSRFTPDDFNINVAAAAIVYLAAYAAVSWRWWPAVGRKTSD